MLSGPLVRSSYRAGRLYEQAISARDRQPVAAARRRLIDSPHGRSSATSTEKPASATRPAPEMAGDAEPAEARRPGRAGTGRLVDDQRAGPEGDPAHPRTGIGVARHPRSDRHPRRQRSCRSRSSSCSAAGDLRPMIFGRRASKTMYAQVEGRPGRRPRSCRALRGDWRVTPAVGFTRNQDLVHRVIGRPAWCSSARARRRPRSAS